MMLVGQPLLVVDQVAKAFRSGRGILPVLDDASLALAVGEVVAVMGRSGSGKTTLLNIVAGWDEPDGGTVRWVANDRPLADASWADVATLPQPLGLLEELSVEENVTLPTRFADVPGALDASTLMWQLGLDHLADRRPAEVSLGEQQRAALARTLILRPTLVVADEPVSHQNHEWIDGCLHLLRDLATQGTTCLLATHNKEVLDSVDRVLVLEHGQLVGA